SRFADTGLADDREHLSLPALGEAQPTLDDLEMVVAPDEAAAVGEGHEAHALAADQPEHRSGQLPARTERDELEPAREEAGPGVAHHDRLVAGVLAEALEHAGGLALALHIDRGALRQPGHEQAGRGDRHRDRR